MSTSANCSHSQNLINSIFVVCTVVSSSDHLHIIAVALPVSSPHLPSMVWYQETDLQCLLIFPWLGNSWSAWTVVIVSSFTKLLSTKKFSTCISTDTMVLKELKISLLQYLYVTFYDERETTELHQERERPILAQFLSVRQDLSMAHCILLTRLCYVRTFIFWPPTRGALLSCKWKHLAKCYWWKSELHVLEVSVRHTLLGCFWLWGPYMSVCLFIPSCSNSFQVLWAKWIF